MLNLSRWTKHKGVVLAVAIVEIGEFCGVKPASLKGLIEVNRVHEMHLALKGSQVFGILMGIISKERAPTEWSQHDKIRQ